MSHAIERTSPTGKGFLFVGRCMKCGRGGLMMKDALKPCPADSDMPDETALLKLIIGEDSHD
jgi:hypothetical protein